MKLNVRFRKSETRIKAHFGEVTEVKEYIGGELYKGSYVVTPAVDAQTLPTAEKVMEEDLKIKAIPFFNVGNNSGGSTVYIGNEV